MSTCIGIDVHSSRDCPYAVMEDVSVVETGWLATSTLDHECRELASRFSNAAFGIDAPRQPLELARKWYWRGGEWHLKRASDKGYGRHCEVVVAALNLARPQWTPLKGLAPEWMQNGFLIFDILSASAPCYEVFPSATYRLLRASTEVRMDISLSAFLPGPKDMLDATVAALTVREFLSGCGTAVGGGDGLGEIILPCKLKPSNQGVLAWPGS